MRTQWMFIVALLFALLTSVFAVINVAPVKVNYLFGEASIPLVLIIIGSMLIGGLVVGIFGVVRQYKLKKQNAALLKQLEQLKPSADKAFKPLESGSLEQ